jgi:hypothetical protein
LTCSCSTAICADWSPFKVGKFHAEYNGLMKLYLKWLIRYELQPHEGEPVGIILCTEGSQEQIELLELDENGIMVAEHWTALPPKDEFEKRIQAILAETRVPTPRPSSGFMQSLKRLSDALQALAVLALLSSMSSSARKSRTLEKKAS